MQEDYFRCFFGGAKELCVSMTGEPLLNKDLESYIVFAKSLGYIYVFFNTNGYYLSEERFLSLLESGVDSIKVSVNAGPKFYQIIHRVDSYNRVRNKVRVFDTIRKRESIIVHYRFCILL